MSTFGTKNINLDVKINKSPALSSNNSIIIESNPSKTPSGLPSSRKLIIDFFKSN